MNQKSFLAAVIAAGIMLAHNTSYAVDCGTAVAGSAAVGAVGGGAAVAAGGGALATIAAEAASLGAIGSFGGPLGIAAGVVVGALAGVYFAASGDLVDTPCTSTSPASAATTPASASPAQQ